MEPARFVPLNKSETERSEFVTITERAVQEIKNALAAEKEAYAGVRLALEMAGHHGYQYAIGFAKAAESDDVVVESGGVKVFVSPQDSDLLKGATVDYIDTPMGSGFHIENPNLRVVGGGCGCGGGSCGCGAGGEGGGHGHSHGGGSACGC